jgi:hypothetical protein
MQSNMKSGRGHGAVDRGLVEAARATTSSQINRQAFAGRFGRLFTDLPGAVFFDPEMVSLAADMSAELEIPQTPETQPDSEENFGLPSGYTYFGQFVDHDITLDAVSLSMRQEDLSAVENFRTPALDLDSLYGRGPDDQPYMYDEAGRLFLFGDRKLTEGKGGQSLTVDLPRFRGRAIIGDKRNDENVIVSQLHGLFMGLHNKLALADPAAPFDAIRQQVRWHYQWLVLFDYLPRIVGHALIDELLPKVGLPPALRYFKPSPIAFMPVEFAGAAYRFGHSMVRPIYRLNAADIDGPDGDKGRRLVFQPPAGQPASEGKGLNGFGEFDASLGIDWSLFFETGGRTLASEMDKGAQRIQPAYKIDTSLAFPLTRLPEFSEEDGSPKAGTAVNGLALRNIKRGMMLLLPSGQAVARAMGIEPISDVDLIVEQANAENFADSPDKPPLRRITTGRPKMAGSAPLWFYVLAEARHEWRKAATAELQGKGELSDVDRDKIIDETPVRLGPLGGRIVAETLIGLAASDPRSLLNEGAHFQPKFGDATKSRYERFTMGDLVMVVSGRS